MSIIHSETTFLGFRRENGRVGVRNHVIILPLDDLSNAAAEAVAHNIKGAMAIPHPYGRLQFGADLDLHFRTLIVGIHAAHRQRPPHRGRGAGTPRIRADPALRIGLMERLAFDAAQALAERALRGAGANEAMAASTAAALVLAV